MSKTADDVLAALDAAIKEAGSVSAWGQANGFSQQYISDLRQGRRRPSERIALALGYRRVTVFVKIAKPEERADATD